VQYLENFIKGIFVGIATLVPGVSGGTMAIILGIYDDLIHAIGSFFEDWKKHTMLLMQIGLGGLLGFGLFSRLMGSALSRYPYLMQYLFMGVIIGGLPVLYHKTSSSDGKRNRGYLFLAIGFALVLLMSSEPTAMTSLATSGSILSVVFLFIAGIVIAIALVLPGISGSFMLLVLGLYSITLDAINNLNIPFLIPLGLGVAVGTLGTTKVIEKLLQRYPRKTYMLIIGFVLGSLVQVFPGIPSGGQLVSSTIALLIGFSATYWLGKKGITDYFSVLSNETENLLICGHMINACISGYKQVHRGKAYEPVLFSL
jgi:putative membrane protein